VTKEFGRLVGFFLFPDFVSTAFPLRFRKRLMPTHLSVSRWV
jgi:hypothetical protein